MNTVVVNEFSKLVKFIQEQLNDAELDDNKKEVNKGITWTVDRGHLDGIPFRPALQREKIRTCDLRNRVAAKLNYRFYLRGCL